MQETHSDLSAEVVDTAFQSAYASNQAFNRLKEAEIQLAALTASAAEKATANTEAVAALETKRARAQTDFDLSSAMAAVVLGWPERKLEHVPHPESLLCTYEEVVEFAKLRGYDKNLVTRNFTMLARCRRGDVSHIEVDDFASYELLEPHALEEGVQIVHLASQKQSLKKKELSARIDKLSLLHHARQWPECRPDIRNFGPGAISFWADYCNHIFPDLEEPLPVPYSPELSRKRSKVAKAAELASQELLLEDITVEGTQMHVVSNRSLRQYAYSIGYNIATAPQFSPLFDSIAAKLAPAARVSGVGVQKINDDLVCMGVRDKSPRLTYHWGMPPESFKRFIAELEASKSSRAQIKPYTPYAAKVIQQYICALDKLLAGEE